MSTCLTCNDGSSCITCDISLYRELDQLTSQCICIMRYY